MSHPHSSSIPPSSGGQTKTLFCVHGIAEATLVIDRAGRMRSEKRMFPDAHAALDWCIDHQANMAFSFKRDVTKN
jgi:hypothetical protein